MLKNQPFRRFVSLIGTRRGSMLIMVIVILVLLALIGTAMMSSARIDRLATAQNSINTQVDLLLESAKNIAKAAIQNDMYGATGATKTFRSGTGYTNYDSVVGSSDTYLASRHPDAGPLWPFITQLQSTTVFESPAKPAVGGLTWTARQNVPIGSKLINGVAYPAFGNFIVGDADGDGIADAGLIKFPIGEINGVTYYYSVRIVDNNSAINASTAWSSAADYSNSTSTATVPNYGFFPSNVGLLEQLTTPAEMSNFNLYRLGKQAAAVTTIPPAVTESAGVVPPATKFGTHGTTTTDFVYASLGDLMNNQIAKRIANPGYFSQGTAAADGTRCNSLPLTDSLSLAYKFVLMNSSASPSVLESTTYGLPASLYNSTSYPVAQRNASVKSKPYLASDYATWYADNFNFGTARPIRSYLTARNPVTNAVSPHDTLSLQNAGNTAGYVTDFNTIGNGATALTGLNNGNGIPANGAVVTKASVNTAPFGYLWRGFWNAMAQGTSTTPPYIENPDAAESTIVPLNTARMFREPLRDPRPHTPARSGLAAPTSVPMTSAEVMMLRSAIASMNTISMRGTQKNDYTIPSRKIYIHDSTNPATIKYEAMVYGGAPQPFITEVYANTSAAYGSHGYVAIELYNPYDFDISLANYNLGVIYRPVPGAAVAPGQNYPYLRIVPITSFLGFGAPGAAPKVPARSWLVINNVGTTSPKDDPVAPAGEGVPPATPGTVFYVPNLSEVFSDAGDLTKPGGELVLLRPRRQIMNTAVTPNLLECDALTKSTNTANLFDETATTTAPTPANLMDLVPVDSFDFTGLAVGTPASWHYVRQSSNTVAATPNADLFKQVYPGKYTSTVAAGTARMQGVQVSDGVVPVATAPTLGAQDAAVSSYTNLIPAIQWMNKDFAGPNRSGTVVNTNTYPFGGFARNGDMMQIPFIGAYRIRQTDAVGVPIAPNPPADGSIFLEMNAVTMDAAMAQDGDDLDDADEQLGRFCPLNLSNPNAYDPAVLAAPREDYYKWTTALFDYLTVSTPNDDYFPNVNPMPSDNALYGFTYTGTLSLATTAFNYPLGQWTATNAAMIPGQVKNTAANVSDVRDATTAANESQVGSEGLININTAPLQVLKSLPWSTTQVNNVLIANYVKAYRDGTAPYDTATGVLLGPHVFTSVADLNKIVDPTDNTKTFQNGFGTLTVTDPDDADGDISPVGVGVVDGVTGDLEQKMIPFTRVSNLITTRSDSFTVYVLVQGWKNTGTIAPELVATRRAAMIVDRTSMSATSNTLNVSTVPAD